MAHQEEFTTKYFMTFQTFRMIMFSCERTERYQGKNGLVPSRPMFLIVPRFSILNSELPAQKERIDKIKIAQAEMNYVVTKRRLLTALTRDIPHTVYRTYNLGEEVLVYSKRSKMVRTIHRCCFYWTTS